jgi:Ca-activated chloride channel family protein
MDNKKDYYSILGIPPTATKGEVKKAYLEAIKIVHPDMNKDVVGTRFFDIQEAFNTLNDETVRSEYDADYQITETGVDLFRTNLLLSKTTLPILSEHQLLYALVDLTSTTYSELDLFEPSLNLCLVIDVSSSMKGHKLEEIKHLCFKLSKTLNKTDTLSIVTFNDFADVVIKAQSPNDDVILNKIQLMQAGGGTEIFSGLEAGYQEIQKYLHADKHNQIILLTDGRTYGDENKCLDLSRSAAGQNIFISCYGIGPEWNDKFLDDVATITGGYSKFVPFGAEYHENILEDIKIISSSKITNIKLQISGLEHCSIRSINRLNPNPVALPALSSVNIGQLPRTGAISLLFEILVGPNFKLDNPLPIVDLKFITTGLYKHRVNKASIINLIMPVSTEPSDGEPPAEIIHALEILQMAKIQEKARADVSIGNVDQAISKLKKLIPILEKNGQVELAKTVHFEIMTIQKTRQFSSDGDKQIKYGTRALNWRDLER